MSYKLTDLNILLDIGRGFLRLNSRKLIIYLPYIPIPIYLSEAAIFLNTVKMNILNL